MLPGPGGDPIRNPGVLPSGKNIHALDPQAIPTRAAIAAAKVVVDRLMERQRSRAGGLARDHRLRALGHRQHQDLRRISRSDPLVRRCASPMPDSVGRVNKLELIPLEELGRPRIDVVVNCSGVFRDLFINQMALIDQAVKLAAEADEPLEHELRAQATASSRRRNRGHRACVMPPAACSPTPAAATART